MRAHFFVSHIALLSAPLQTSGIEIVTLAHYVSAYSPLASRSLFRRSLRSLLSNPSFSANASRLDLNRSKKVAFASMLLFLCLALRLALRSAANVGHRNRDARAIRFCIFTSHPLARYSVALSVLSFQIPVFPPKRTAAEPSALLFLHRNLSCLILKIPPYNGKWQSLNNRALILPARANLA